MFFLGKIYPTPVLLQFLGGMWVCGTGPYGAFCFLLSRGVPPPNASFFYLVIHKKLTQQLVKENFFTVSAQSIT